MLSAPQTHLNINIVWLGLDKEWSAECTSSGGYPNINVPTRPDAVGPVPSAGLVIQCCAIVVPGRFSLRPKS